jgi:hypothetical protein
MKEFNEYIVKDEITGAPRMLTQALFEDIITELREIRRMIECPE